MKVFGLQSIHLSRDDQSSLTAYLLFRYRLANMYCHVFGNVQANFRLFTRLRAREIISSQNSRSDFGQIESI